MIDAIPRQQSLRTYSSMVEVIGGAMSDFEGKLKEYAGRLIDLSHKRDIGWTEHALIESVAEIQRLEAALLAEHQRVVEEYAALKRRIGELEA